MNCANHPDRERIAFCQNCGKPLCQECARTVGTAVFCEPCLEARLAAASTPAGAGYTAPAGAGYSTYTDPAAPYAAPSPIPPPPPTGAPNPGLAALLGFIPGVGAMYNGQYAKGIVHLIVFAVLASLADDHGIFGVLVAGWLFYQVFEAYQTAVARRDGTPLPNPFGLNDLAERVGFGKSWAAPTPAAPGDTYVPPAANYAPAAPFTPSATYTPEAPSTPYTPPAAYAPPQQAPWDNQWSNYVPPTANPYMTNPPAFDPNAPMPGSRNRFPTGAIWLIGLGALFLVGNTGLFHGFPVHILLPFFLIALGGWIFYNKMTATGATLADDGTALYRMRLYSALRGSVWVVLVGVLFLLANLHILSWGRSWPLFIIVAGLLTFFERTAVSSARVPAYPGQPYQTPPPTASSPTSVVPPSAPADIPNNQNNEEGR